MMTESQSQQPSPGDFVESRYLLRHPLGRGATGSVWAATQLSVDRTVAIKFLDHPHDSEFTARFEVEARAVARLNHPHCVTLFDFGFSAHHGTHFIVLEHAAGPLLNEIEVETMPAVGRVQVVRDIARALRHAHDLGILHRDLKPENVCLTETEEHPNFVKVLDFGLARILREAAEDGQRNSRRAGPMRRPRITEAGLVCGTPAYMSPEQALGSRDLTGATDVYALGMLFAELLQGRLPLEGEDVRDTLEQQVYGEPDLDTTLPDALRSLIEGMLRKEADRRPTAVEVVDELDRYLAANPAEKSSAATVMAVPPAPVRTRLTHPSIVDTVPATPDRSRLRAIVGAMAVIAMSASALAWTMQPEDAPAPPGTEEASVGVEQFDATGDERPLRPESPTTRELSPSLLAANIDDMEAKPERTEPPDDAGEVTKTPDVDQQGGSAEPPAAAGRRTGEEPSAKGAEPGAVQVRRRGERERFEEIELRL